MNGQTAVASQKIKLLPAAQTKKETSKVASKTASKKKYRVIPRKTLLKILISALVLILLVGGVFGYTYAYDGKIYPKATIAGVNVGGMTIAEVKSAISKKAEELNQEGPKITYNDQTLTPTLEEMGVTFNIDEAIQDAYKYGRQDSLIDKIKENWQMLVHGYQIPISPQIDQEKFDAYLGQLAQVVEKEPVNASLSIANGTIMLASAENGRGLDKESLKKDITEFINSGKNGEIAMVTSNLEPAISEAGTLDAKSQAEKYLSAAPITVSFEDSAWVADRSEIGRWISFQESGNQVAASINPSGFISWVAKQVEISAVDREIEESTGNVLAEGQDGRGVDTNTLTAQIRDALANGQSVSFALLTFAIPRGETIIYPHAQPGRYAGRYIDINLSEQTLYAFEGSTLANQFLVSTGKSGYATPTGEFNIYGMDSSVLMDGPDYYLPNVPWVSWFLGDYSIHGTYWHSNFGTPMSHGCVNASIPDAEWIYNWATIGTPVYVHY